MANNFVFSPIIKEFTKKSDKNPDEYLDGAYNHWYNGRLVGKASGTIKNAHKALSVYLYYLRTKYDNHVMPVELIDEAHKQQYEQTPSYQKVLSTYLNGFIVYLHDSGDYSFEVQQQYLRYIKGFYISNDIMLDPKGYNAIIPDEDEEEVKNAYHLSKTQIRQGLNASSHKMIRALSLGIVSSGLSKVDILKLTVDDYRKGYDTKYKICHLKIKRQKTRNKNKRFIHNTFFSVEACEAIDDYIYFRHGYGKDYSELSGAEKRQYIYSDDDVLFCKPEPRTIFLNYVNGEVGYAGMVEIVEEVKKKNEIITKIKEINPDVYYRKFNNANEVDRYYQEASIKANLYEQGIFSYFRCHNLRRYFSTAILNAPECRFDVKEHFMGHSQGSADFYDQYDDELIKGEYLKIMKYLTISDTAELQQYKNSEHQREIEYLNKRIDLAKTVYNESVGLMESNIEGYEHDIQDIDIQLQNTMLKLDAIMILKSQRKNILQRIEHLQTAIESKKNKHEIELEQLELEREVINERHKDSN